MELIKENWTQQDYVEYCKLLLENAEDGYKKFHMNLCKTSKAEILGVRLPTVKKFAKDISKGNVVSFLECCKNNTYEEIMTQGLVIAFYKKPFVEKQELVSNFISKIDNWAICDSFCGAIKPKKNELDDLYDFCIKFVYSEKEYDIRFATVIMMDNLIIDKYIDKLLEILDKTNTSFYYTSMAVAWSLSFCFIKFKEKTLEYMKKSNMDNATFNRAIQKIVDSNRVTAEDKDLVRTMKRK